MRQTWRWFGPADLASIDDIVQAGAQGVVTALHHVPNGAVWTEDEIATRQQQVATRKDGSPSGIGWDVIESLPVSEDIKKQKGEWRSHIANYKTSLENVARAGLEAKGVLFNDITLRPGRYGYGAGYGKYRQLPYSGALPERGNATAYDIRGVVGKTLDEAVAEHLGRAFGTEALKAGEKAVCVGRDGRLSGPGLAEALMRGLASTGLDVVDLGAVTTPIVYYVAATRSKHGCSSGIQVTGSHNPKDYNGFKM
eukprot:gene45477-60762_t